MSEFLSTLKIRCIKIELTLDQGKFPDVDKSLTKVITGYSIPNSLHIDVNLKEQMETFGNTASVCIYGMTRDDCEALTKYNSIGLSYNHYIKIFAGYIDDEEYLKTLPLGDINLNALKQKSDEIPLVYTGQIVMAMMDMNNKNRPFYITAMNTGYTTGMYLKPLQQNVEISFEELVKRLVNDFNNDKRNKSKLTYKVNMSDNFVYKKVSNVIYEGDLITQLRNLCSDYGYSFKIETNRLNDKANPQNYNIVIGDLKKGYLGNSKELYLSRDTGMIGYPIVDSLYFKAEMYFDPEFSPGRKLILDTDYQALNNKESGKDYLIYSIESQLETNGPEWRSILTISPQKPQFDDQEFVS